MSDWKIKRFWTAATLAMTEGGFAVELDGCPVRTPAKALLQMPTRQMAQAVCEEWDAQTGKIDPGSMPMTKSANAAIDKVTVQFAEVAAMLAAYGDSDLTCYRAAGPRALADRQAAAWDPLLDWAAERFGARLIPVEGVIHHAQPTASLAGLRAPLDAMSAFELTAMHDLVSLSGSLVMALAASETHLPPQELWRRSRIDEDWQIEQWGRDEEAANEAEMKGAAFLHAARFLDLARGQTTPTLTGQATDHTLHPRFS